VIENLLPINLVSHDSRLRLRSGPTARHA